MQTLSFAVHIPLVCFGIAFPALLLYVESLYLRTGDELYRTLARRWTVRKAPCPKAPQPVGSAR